MTVIFDNIPFKVGFVDFLFFYEECTEPGDYESLLLRLSDSCLYFI